MQLHGTEINTLPLVVFQFAENEHFAGTSRTTVPMKNRLLKVPLGRDVTRAIRDQSPLEGGPMTRRADPLWVRAGMLSSTETVALPLLYTALVMSNRAGASPARSFLVDELPSMMAPQQPMEQHPDYSRS